MENSNSDITDIITDFEHHRLDFKEYDKINDKKGMARHFVAFANREGGVLALGITDDTEIEGVNINEDKAVRQISEISRLYCDPPVQFTHRYYPDFEYDSKTGDILIVDISAFSDIPHSVIDPASAVGREYYVRTGNESRPITKAQEISQLFTGSIDPDFSERFRFPCVVNYQIGNPAGIYPKSTPTYLLERGMSFISSEDRKSLVKGLDSALLGESLPIIKEKGSNDGKPSIAYYMHELLPILILSSMEFWDGAVTHEYKNKDGERELIDTIQIKKLRNFEWHHNGRWIDKLDISEENIRELFGERPAISVPAGTEIEIIYTYDESYHPHSQLVFSKKPAFEHVISVTMPGNVMAPGIPSQHPGYIQDDSEDKIGTLQFSVRSTCKYGFPDNPDPHIELHSEFGESINEHIRKLSFDRFIEQSPDPEIFRISKMLEEIYDQCVDV